MQRWLALGVVLSQLALMTACSDLIKDGWVVRVPRDWSIDKVHLSCPTHDCPSSVGLFAQLHRGLTETQLSRCTATLIKDDQILTNSHCDANFETGWFAARANNGRLITRSLAAKVVDFPTTQQDVAIWRLSSPITEIEPTSVSRKIPANMSDLVSFVINLDGADEWQASYRLDRRECASTPHLALEQSGVDDKTARLALFECQIVHGNSGAPVFSRGDSTHVQALMEAIDNDTPESRQKNAANLAPKFLGPVPPPVRNFLAFAVRIQCFDVPGLPPPGEICPLSSTFESARQGVIDGELKRRNKKPALASGILWNTGWEPWDENAHEFLDFLPQPICVRDVAKLSASASAPPGLIVRTGYDEESQMDLRVEGTHPVTVQAHAYDRDTFSIQISYNGPDGSYRWRHYAIQECSRNSGAANAR